MSLAAAPRSNSAILAYSALSAMALIKIAMLAAIFSGTEPHPPSLLAPTFAATLALSALAAGLIAMDSRWFLLPAVPLVLDSLLSFGPHKLYPGAHPAFFAQTPAVYPVIFAGSLALLLFCLASWRLLRKG